LDNPDDSKFCKECGTNITTADDVQPSITKTIETPREELTTGSTFAGRYQIIEELGKGGMGKVYKATDTEIDTKIAIKLIKPEIASHKKTIERFRNELRVARDISHPNVCRMYDLNKEEGSYYITMEYVSGEDLKSFIHRSGQLTKGTAIKIAKQICDGLSEAHKLGIVHRDLKSNNIMIDRDGDVRIMDFGIARSLSEKGITGAGVMIGTPEYMSPEQVEGKSVDQRSDIYSLGIILYEMVTGRLTFEGDTAFTIGMKHKSEIPINPQEFNEQIPDELSDVILTCLRKNKDTRYQSAGELRLELERLERGIPTTARKVPKKKPLTSREITVTFGLKKLWIPAAVVLGLIVVAVLLWQVLPRKVVIPPPSGKPSLAIMYFENNTGDENLDHYRKAISDLLITDLSQSRYLDVVGGDRLYDIMGELSLLDAENYSTRDLQEVASLGEVSHIIQGNYTKAEDEFRINVMLHETQTMDRVSSEMFEGTGEKSIFSMVDRITDSVKASFEISGAELAADVDEDIEDITTASPEAFKYYTQARRYHHEGKYRESIQIMEKAVEIDPEFAMAYRSLAMSYASLSFHAEEKQYIEKALELAGRLPDRERFQIMGDYYGTAEKTYDRSIEAYKKLLELYPDNTTANHNLGNRYYGIEEWESAIERYEAAINLNTTFVHTYTALANAYRAKEMYQEAREALESYISRFGDAAAIRRGLAHIHRQRGDLGVALAEAEKAFLLAPEDWLNFQLRGDLYLCQGKMEQAEAEYRKMLDSSEPSGQGWGRARLANLYEYQGRFEEALRMWQQNLPLAKRTKQRTWECMILEGLAVSLYHAENLEEALEACEQALKIARDIDFLANERTMLFYKGRILLEMDLISEAQNTAEELKTLIEKDLDQKIIRLYHHLKGRIELKNKNFSGAIARFQKALTLESYGPLNKSADTISSMASAYYRSGNLEKAVEQYQRIHRLTTGRLGEGVIYVKSFYWLGKIYEQQGDTAKAIENYEEFLDLWKDADPGLPEVADARERAAGLR